MPRVPHLRLPVLKDRLGYPMKILAQREGGPCELPEATGREGVISTSLFRAARNSGFGPWGNSASGRGVGEEGGGGETKNILKCLQDRTRPGQHRGLRGELSHSRTADPELPIFLGPLYLLCSAAVYAERGKRKCRILLIQKNGHWV